MAESDVSQHSKAPGGRWGLPGLWLGAFALYLVGNAEVPLWDRDESRYAQATIQMRLRGDYLVPYYLTFDNSGDPARPDPRFHKPPVVYWTQAAACAVFGENEFALRFPSAVFGATAVVLVALLGATLYNARVGFWAAVVLAVAPLMQVMSKICLCDAPLICFTAAALLLLARQLRHGPSGGASAAMWACLGLALLAKGPVCFLFFLSPVIFLAVGGGADIRARLGRCLTPIRLDSAPAVLRVPVRAGTGLAIALVIVGAWVIPVQMATGDFTAPDPETGEPKPSSFLHVSMGTHVIKRAVTPMENHKGPPGYYVGLVLLTFFPWSFLLPMAMWTGLRKPASDSPTPRLPDSPTSDSWVRLFLMGWAIFPWVFLEFHATKLPHYFLPTLPALALLVARFLFAEGSSPAYWRGGPRWAAGAMTVALVGACLGAAGAVYALVEQLDVPGRLPLEPGSESAAKFAGAWRVLGQVEPGLFAGALALAVVSIGLTIWGERLLRQGRAGGAVGTLAAMCAVGGVLLGTLIVPKLTPLTTSKRVAEWIAGNAPAGDVVLLGYYDDNARLKANYIEDSLVFYLRGRARRAKTPDEAAKWLGSGRPMVLVADPRYWKELQPRVGLPEPAVFFEGFNYVKGRAVRLGVGAVPAK